MITNASAPSKIAATVADTLLAIFSGQTVAHDDVCAEIANQYAMARKRCTYGSHIAVDTGLRIAGVQSQWSGPNYSGDHFYAFPVRAI